MNYFDLVATNISEKKLSSAEIENGLTIAAQSIAGCIGTSQQTERTSVLLDRFVYNDTDRRSDKVTSIALGILKTLGREIKHSEDIATRRTLDGLLDIAEQAHGRAVASTDKILNVNLDNYAGLVCEEALTCIANAMLLRPECKQGFSDAHGFDVIARILDSKSLSPTVDFLCGRCLFLSLVGSSGSVERLVSHLKLQTGLAKKVQLYLDQNAETLISVSRFSPQQVMAELLKASMNLCVGFQRGVGASKSTSDDSIPPEHASDFAQLLGVSLDTIRSLPVPTAGHLAEASKQAFSIALNFSTLRPESIKSIWLPDTGDRWANVDSIYTIFDRLVRFAVGSKYTKGSTDTADTADKYQVELTPVALVLVRLMAEHVDVRQRILDRVYPQAHKSEHSKLPEDRSGISGKLVRLLRIPQGGMLPGAIGDFLLTLLSQDVKQFVMATGYGNAAGYLLARGIDIPADVLKDVGSGLAEQLPVDPVTGRAFDQAEIDRELAAMSNEEKEREAERLFVLLERLNKTGVIKVQNPIHAAWESGRFHELSSDEE
ncbi:hypothetical protein LPJ53_003783 [Coemansia erecta]|uniref:Uncharacterized protein n=1 Tax=Coemansia erecta TaxID=147472 RepID=A0A9W7XZX4_9FUNG|nr:hypothetical protein LPJ53_003783 [Coemansia erecta]